MDRQINHKTMRLVVGAIAFLLGPTTCLLAEPGKPLTSISISYWTDARDVFVGSLIAVGFFLFAYNGSSPTKGREYYVSKFSSLFAICVALFPTDGFADSSAPPAWVERVAALIGVRPSHVHYVSAILLFLCLIYMMWCFSISATKKGKTTRALHYRLISIAMAAGIIGLLAIGSALGWPNKILIVEMWGLFFFGFGWLYAGAYKTEPELNQP